MKEYERAPSDDVRLAIVDKEPSFILCLKKLGYTILNAFPSYTGILNYAKLSLGKKNLVLQKKR